MKRLPRFPLARLLSMSVVAAPAVALACVLAAPLSDARAQQTPAAAPEPTTEPAAPAGEQPAAPAPDAAAAPAQPEATAPAASGDVRKLVEDYWHYGKIARYDLAATSANALVASNPDPAAVLAAFEAVASERHDNLDDWLLRFQNIEQTRQPTEQVIQLLNKGRYTRRSEPQWIRSQIDRLNVNERAYLNAIAALRDAGELSVPFMIEYLRDPSKQQYQPAIRRALRDLGRYSLNPLTASTEMQDWDTLVVVIGALGDLGYDAAVPYLQRLMSSSDAPATVKNAAAGAIQRITGSRGAAPANAGAAAGSAALSFYQLGEKFYYDTAAIQADPRNPAGYMWYWAADRGGLIKIDVPPQIFNELMAMRATEYAMKLGGGQVDALSLWLASNYKREVELPEGQKDPTRAENQPDAHYYGVSAGAQYLNAALARALNDYNSQVSFKVIRSLQQIAGHSNVLPGGIVPLVDAMSYPDRVVRFEAAFAVAGARPQQSFQGQDRVVPLLAEAIAQTGQQTVLVAVPTQDQFNSLAEGLKGQGFVVAGGTDAGSAMTAAEQLAGVDVILVSEELPPVEVDRLLNARGQSAKLAGAARLVMVQTGASQYEQRKAQDRMLNTTQARDAAALKPAIDEARQRASSLPVDAAVATQYATRAGELLRQLAISRGQVLDISVAQTTLLNALNDPRPEIVKLAGSVLAMLNAREAQIGLATVAGDEKTADDVKISLYRSLAESAKFHGNQLDAQQVEALTKVVAEAQNLEVRSAAAEAHGALNLPADQAKSLIVKQAKV